MAEKKETIKTRLHKTYVGNTPLIKDAGGKDVRMYHWDNLYPGFCMRVSARHKTYMVYARIKDRLNDAGRPMETRETIGRVGVINHDDAEKIAKEIIENAAKGISPSDVKQEKERERKTQKKLDITLGEIYTDYLDDNNGLKDSTKDFYKTYIDVVLADWKNRPIRSLTGDEIKKRHKELSVKIQHPKQEPVKRKSRKKADIESGINDLRKVPKKNRTNGPGAANSAMKALRVLMNYTILNHPEVMKVNPIEIKMKKNWNTLKPRENYINPDRLPAWYNAVKSSDNSTMRDALLLLLFTGLRSESEGFALKWEDIDWTVKIMVFRDTKNHSTLTLPMSRQIFDILDSRKGIAKIAGEEAETVEDTKDKSEFVLPSKQAESGHIEDIRKELAKVNKKAGFRITPHDLRRTFMTYLHQCGVDKLTIQALVNHATDNPSSSITDDYIQVELFKRRAAIIKVNKYMMDIVDGKYKMLFEEEVDF